MRSVEQAVLIFDSPDDRTLLLEEAAGDPTFARRLEHTLSLMDGEKKVAMSARRAIVNELSSNLYPETKGLWRKLRSVVRDLIDFTSHSIRQGNLDGRIRSDAVRRLQGLGELGQWEILGQVVGAVVQAGASAYTAYNQADTAKQLQQMQIDAQMRAIQAQETIARAQAAMAASQAQQAAALAPAGGALTSVMNAASTPIMGVPLWAVAIGLYFLAEKAK